MSNTARVASPYRDTQRREAAEWFVVIRETQEPSAEVLQAWWRWMQADEGNRLAFEAIAQAWHATPPSLVLAMPTAAEIEADGYDGAVAVSQWLVRAMPAGINRVARRRRWTLATLATAAALIVVMLAPRVFELLHTPAASFAGEYATRTGEHLEIALIDGSRVSLGAKSRIIVGIDDQQRNVRLTQGEAFFTVQKDRGRPFRVHALNGVITAVGTAFNVRTAADRVTVTVTEGVVEVRDEAARRAGATEPSVKSGQQLVFIAQAPGSTRTPASLTVAAAPEGGERARWREGWLVYRNEPLRYVIADIARYTDRPLEVSDVAAAQLRFSGAVHESDIDEWLSALPESFPVSVEFHGARLEIRSR